MKSIYTDTDTSAIGQYRLGPKTSTLYLFCLDKRYDSPQGYSKLLLRCFSLLFSLLLALNLHITLALHISSAGISIWVVIFCCGPVSMGWCQCSSCMACMQIRGWLTATQGDISCIGGWFFLWSWGWPDRVYYILKPTQMLICKLIRSQVRGINCLHFAVILLQPVCTSMGAISRLAIH